MVSQFFVCSILMVVFFPNLQKIRKINRKQGKITESNKSFCLPCIADFLKATRWESETISLSQIFISSQFLEGIENFTFDEPLMLSPFSSTDLEFIVFSLVNNSDTKFMEEELSTNKSGSK